MMLWMAAYFSSSSSVDFAMQCCELEKRIERLELLVHALLSGEEDRGWLGVGTTPQSESAQRIQTCVEKFMASKTGVLGGVERMLYCKVLKMLMEVIKDGLGTAKVQFYGHEIEFTLKPIPLQ